ncbi:MAG: hypothetical protein Harvfovirus51_13 [Harvfovirus sp.]|uniref:Uncharacterized protein n=1 Tax=Harvfovirus sp. TaxID=2487768 RepID=A0A3G5A607_9VIRU|nr:MAG: hypothetical protein Harvfovirus51_13 [Harvfovirus sp.]
MGETCVSIEGMTATATAKKELQFDSFELGYIGSDSKLLAVNTRFRRIDLVNKEFWFADGDIDYTFMGSSRAIVNDSEIFVINKKFTISRDKDGLGTSPIVVAQSVRIDFNTFYPSLIPILRSLKEQCDKSGVVTLSVNLNAMPFSLTLTNTKPELSILEFDFAYKANGIGISILTLKEKIEL